MERGVTTLLFHKSKEVVRHPPTEVGPTERGDVGESVMMEQMKSKKE
jgi:hypothetical protein